MRGRLLDRARLAPSDAVLDLTVDGLLVLAALERLGPDGSVIAIDVSADRLEELRRKCDDSRLWYLVGSAAVLPLPDASVDVAIAELFSQRAGDTAEAARDLARVLKPGGRVSIAELPDHAVDELASQFAGAGFAGLDVEARPAAVFLAGRKP